MLTVYLYYATIRLSNKKAAPNLPRTKAAPIKKKGSYIIAQVKRNEKNKQQGS